MLDGIAFNIDLAIWPDATIEQARIVYKLDVNEFRGNQTVQLMVDYIEPM
jgi:single-stranded-DNA-specific exonuclease